jgi:hypothetical protein
VGTVDELGRAAPGRDAAMVVAVEVVGLEVVRELASQAAVADLEEARERWPPALLEDCPVQTLDVAVCLCPERIWLCSTAAGRREANSRRPNSLPLSESTRSSRQPARWRSRAIRRASAEVCSTVGPAGGQTTRSAQANEE